MLSEVVTYDRVEIQEATNPRPLALAANAPPLDTGALQGPPRRHTSSASRIARISSRPLGERAHAVAAMHEHCLAPPRRPRAAAVGRLLVWYPLCTERQRIVPSTLNGNAWVAAPGTSEVCPQDARSSM